MKPWLDLREQPLLRTQCGGVHIKVAMALGAVGRTGLSWKSIQSEMEKSKSRHTDDEGSYRRAHEKSKRKWLGGHRTISGALKESDNQSTLLFWALSYQAGVQGDQSNWKKERPPSWVDIHSLTHLPLDTLNVLHAEELYMLTPRGGKGDWEFNVRELRQGVHHALTTMSATTDSV